MIEDTQSVNSKGFPVRVNSLGSTQFSQQKSEDTLSLQQKLEDTLSLQQNLEDTLSLLNE